MTEELSTDTDDIVIPPPNRPGRRPERLLRRYGHVQLVTYQDQQRLLTAILDVCGYIFDHTPTNIAALNIELQWYDPEKVVDGIRALHAAGHLNYVKKREKARHKQPRRWQVGNGGC